MGPKEEAEYLKNENLGEIIIGILKEIQKEYEAMKKWCSESITTAQWQQTKISMEKEHSETNGHCQWAQPPKQPRWYMKP